MLYFGNKDTLILSNPPWTMPGAHFTML